MAYLSTTEALNCNAQKVKRTATSERQVLIILLLFFIIATPTIILTIFINAEYSQPDVANKYVEANSTDSKYKDIIIQLMPNGQLKIRQDEQEVVYSEQTLYEIQQFMWSCFDRKSNKCNITTSESMLCPYEAKYLNVKLCFDPDKQIILGQFGNLHVKYNDLIRIYTI